MKQKRSSLDGFVPRRATTKISDGHHEPTESISTRRRQELHTGDTPGVDMSVQPKDTTVGMGSIRQSLEAIDSEGSENQQPISRRERRRLRKDRNRASKKRRVVKRVAIAIGIIIIGVAIFLGVRAFINLNNVFQGDFLSIVQKQPLKEDENGRSNFLIFGTEEEGHPGANLTDSIMVLSVNQTSKDAYMISIPRDLWVDYGGACLSGYQGKVNEVYMCGSDDGENEEEGAAALQGKVGEVLGLDIQYYVHLNFAALTDIVDAVGGVTVTVESNPKGMGILDRNFDWKCNYECYYVKYDDGQVVTLDGEHALAFSRARNAQGGYGLAGGNFDREKNQQKVIKALREKALSVGTLTNLGKVTALMDALGNNFITNVETKEIQTVMSLASDIDTSAISSLTLVDEDDPLVTTGSVGSASAVYPVAGMFDYSAIKAYIAKNSSSNPVTKEGAKVVVLNGTTSSGVAAAEAEVLTKAGYTVSATDDAPEGTYADAEVYQIGEGMTATANALAKRYGVTLKTTTPPLAVGDDVSFVIVIGKAQE